MLKHFKSCGLCNLKFLNTSIFSAYLNETSCFGSTEHAQKVKEDKKESYEVMIVANTFN